MPARHLLGHLKPGLLDLAFLFASQHATIVETKPSALPKSHLFRYHLASHAVVA